MSKLPPAKKWTPEVLRSSPLLGRLARIRLKQLKEARPAGPPLVITDVITWGDVRRRNGQLP